MLASSPVVGSSRKRTEGSMISSIPMFVLFLSPPEIPRLICVPTWEEKKKNPMCQPAFAINQSWRLNQATEQGEKQTCWYEPWSRPPWWDLTLRWGDWLGPPSHSEGRRWAAAVLQKNSGSPSQSGCPWPRPPGEECQSLRARGQRGGYLPLSWASV